jgi:mannose-6-phosphate isomerase
MNIFEKTEAMLLAAGYTFERKDFERPWGGFLVIDESHKQRFIETYFNDIPEGKYSLDMKLSPKMLIVAPGQRLSWQYHHRRSEIWQVYEGEVGVVKSPTDEETPMKNYQVGDQILLAEGERHRLVGLEDYGIVAEIWVHSDAQNPSDEADIVRLQDDFNRKTPNA